MRGLGGGEDGRGKQVRAQHMRREAGEPANLGYMLRRHAAYAAAPVANGAADHAQAVGQLFGASGFFDGGLKAGRGGEGLVHDGCTVHHTCTDRQAVSYTDKRHAVVHNPAAMEQLILSERDHRHAVGVRLRQLIQAIGIKYVEAAAEMGIERNHLGNWMDGRAYPKHYELYKFCRIRGVNTDWVYLGDPSGLPDRVSRALIKQALEPEGLEASANQAGES
jgi:transcriptional regulator with XRE-family HTH domain